MSNFPVNAIKAAYIPKPFWVIWAIELWERFGYYGVQAILAMYFVQQLGYSEAESFYVFGSFSAFVYGFVWVGGWIGDNYFGAKRTLLLGAVILTLSYAGLALATHATVFYALAGIVVGNALFKANPSSLISKMYEKGDPSLDSAMTLYYMAINVGSMFSMAMTPVVAQHFGWGWAYGICAFGLMLGIANYVAFHGLLDKLNFGVGKEPVNIQRLVILLVASVVAIAVVAQLLTRTQLCNWIVWTVVTLGFIYFLKITFSLEKYARNRMLVAFVLILQGILFFVLYNQMPTSLTFFAMHNIDNQLWGWAIPPAEYQVLNSVVIVVASPILAWAYRRHPATHVTKFCIGMTLCALGYLVLVLPQYTAPSGIASPWWMLLTYTLQSVGELLISGLGLAMVAELCPKEMSGYVMGMWFLTVMLAGPIGAWVGAMTAPPGSTTLTTIASMQLYCGVFFKIGLVTGAVALLMWMARPALNRFLKREIENPNVIL